MKYDGGSLFPKSDFLSLTSYFLPPTSYFLPPTSYLVFFLCPVQFIMSSFVNI